MRIVYGKFADTDFSTLRKIRERGSPVIVSLSAFCRGKHFFGAVPVFEAVWPEFVIDGGLVIVH